MDESMKTKTLLLVLLALLVINAILWVLELFVALMKGDLPYALAALIRVIILCLLAYYSYKRNKSALVALFALSLMGLRDSIRELSDPLSILWLLMQIVICFLSLAVLFRLGGVKFRHLINDTENKPSFTKSLLKFFCIVGSIVSIINTLVYFIIGISSNILLEDVNLLLFCLATPAIILITYYFVKRYSYFGMLFSLTAIFLVSGLPMIVDFGPIHKITFVKGALWAIYVLFLMMFFLFPTMIIIAAGFFKPVFDAIETTSKNNK